MPQLILTTAGGGTHQFLLKPHDNTLGRGVSNDIVIPSAEASRQHAVITVEAAFVTIKDVGSRNGTFVNGERIESQVLVEGDVIRLGAQELRFIADDQEFSRVEALRVPTVPSFPPSLDRDHDHAPTMPDEPQSRRGKL
ncbi:FHA domain-containing protein [Variovorax sp. GT1P44]|uniref:FHA domain-containing protein n=1 Tax=Variovorax sp. GT1P44 TaxID=3443742 RepID=UPI003F4547B0